MYAASVASVISIQLLMSAVSMVLDHCHIWPVTLPSGSTTSPVIVSPTCGAIVRATVGLAHRVTIPGSSTLVTIIVTLWMSVLVPSLAFTVTS